MDSTDNGKILQVANGKWSKQDPNFTQDIQQAVSDYCQENMSEWSGGLDHSLTNPLMAAPADIVGEIKSALTNFNVNNVLSFVKQTKSVLGVSVDCDGFGAFKLTGSATSNGGRTVKLTNLGSVPAGTYYLSYEIEGATLTYPTEIYLEDESYKHLHGNHGTYGQWYL